MKIAFSATNPCHMYPLAKAIHAENALDYFYSGYPRWRLNPPSTMPIRTHSLRTLITYGMLRIPERYRIKSRDLFTWQDTGFDRWAGHALTQCDEVHAMPGQCLETFRKAQKTGVRTVLNHATGPVRAWVRIMEKEYARVGKKLALESRYDDAYFAREQEEYAFSDYHCAASVIVKEQLIEEGIDPKRIWVVPYGADSAIFHSKKAKRSELFRILFAGQFCLRKGVQQLLETLTLAGKKNWIVDCYGAVLNEAQEDLKKYKGTIPIHFHGAVDQESLANAFRSASVLILPSLEEGFGLVVPQALSCGLPCIVSDRVGAKDLIMHRKNGSLFTSGDRDALLNELQWWEQNPTILNKSYSWTQPAQLLLAQAR